MRPNCVKRLVFLSEVFGSKTFHQSLIKLKYVCNHFPVPPKLLKLCLYNYESFNIHLEILLENFKMKSNMNGWKVFTKRGIF